MTRDLYDAIRDARQECSDAADALYEVLRVFFPIGRQVNWIVYNRGKKHLQTGTVVSAQERGRYGQPCLWAENNKTGKVRRIEAYDILQAEGL